MEVETKPKVTKTILVSQLPKTAGKREIEEYFSEAGPIKRCFLVREGGKFRLFIFFFKIYFYFK